MAAENLSNCLDISCGIPTDVRFLFIKEKIGKELKAHKFPLAVASDVFQRAFYGSMKKEATEEEDVKIVDATMEVFKTMVEFIYNKELNWNAFDLHFLSSLYYLGDKYNIANLKASVLNSIADHQRVNMENVLVVATLAEENVNLYPLYEQLYQMSVACLDIHFQGSYKEVVKFFSDPKSFEADPRIVAMLMQKLLVFKSVVSCSNCCKFPCIDGEEPTVENFTPGARVRNTGGAAIVRLVNVKDNPATFVGSIHVQNGITVPCSFGVGYYFYNCK
eukprot:GFUD01010142.1.p1 GENE.GFUD01010142.1~~GFUD01010142.1.p1  ORF type:complete len:276 (-),score=47.71 GFUD01010142.1:38-865(-)